jgi:hypothetical protein
VRTRVLHKVVDAIRQGLAAHREYESLMSMGMRHDPALRAALSMSTATRDRPIANSRALSRLNARTTPLMSPAPQGGGKLYGNRHEHKFRVAALVLLLLSSTAFMGDGLILLLSSYPK